MYGEVEAVDEEGHAEEEDWWMGKRPGSRVGRRIKRIASGHE